MTQQLEDLKKQRLIAELQEKILAEQQAIEATRQRLSLATAAASISPQNSPAPLLAHSSVPSPGPASSAPHTPQHQPVERPPASAPRASPTINASTISATAVVATLPRPAAPAVQQLQTLKRPAPAPALVPAPAPAPAPTPAAVSVSPVKPLQISSVQSASIPTTPAKKPTSFVTNGTLTPTNPSTQVNSASTTPAKQQQQGQLQWYERPRTPGAPNESSRDKIPEYTGETQDNYANFITALEAHFAKAPKYYTKECDYRRVKLALEHVCPAERERWYASSDRTATWYGFRAFLVKDTVRKLKAAEQARSARKSVSASPAPTPAAEPRQPVVGTTTQSSGVQQAQPLVASIQPTIPSQPAPVTQPTTPAVASPATNAGPMAPPPFRIPPSSAKPVAQAQVNEPKTPNPTTPVRIKVETAVTPVDTHKKPSARSEEAYARYRNGQQEPGETVSLFSAWLQRLLPDIDVELSLEDRMGFLKRGVVSAVRNRAHRPFTYFKTYADYVSYLQDIEDTLPQRQAEMKQPSSSHGKESERSSSYRSGISSEQPRRRSPSVSRGRSADRDASYRSSRGLSRAPSVRASSIARPSASSRGPSPPPPNIQLTAANTFFSCRQLISGMEDHFQNHRRYFIDDSKKVSCAEQFLAPVVSDAYRTFSSRRALPITWFDFCVFLLNYSSSSHRAPDAIMKYNNSYQRANQSIWDFALWIQQYAPHYQKGDKDERKHLLEHSRQELQMAARQNYKGYPTLASYV
ncbi:Uncharacterized protein PECH_006250 [Penicillium ucsense]|uniref:Uncharacterized protein n=1 Tax=Penicillium ucsense TaxID=2839758 RepID=A0A8J8WG08_9EURO|nr:Uncharacterized protein PECM_000850 [Penicillium ucsense]KAF7739050.1 Uncharacterized protein PECH_006250 [Penicillium ucsense]